MLIDLDGVAVGLRGVDLVLPAMYVERLGSHATEDDATFVKVCGFDVINWPGYPVLRDIREMLMVTWLAQNTQEPTDRCGGSQEHC